MHSLPVMSAERDFSCSDGIHIRLVGFLALFNRIPAALMEHVVHEADGHQVEVSDRKPQLDAP